MDKVATKLATLHQTISYLQILCLLTEQQITGFRVACPMARKPLCVATQHDLRKILPRSSTKKFFGSFFQKRTETPFFVTFFKKWQIHFLCNLSTNGILNIQNKRRLQYKTIMR